MLAALRMARRGRRATRRSPNSAGTGSFRDSRISESRRLGRRGASARALTVLIRAARIAGTSVDASATASATPRAADDRDERERRRSRSTDEVGLGLGEQRGGTPAGQQADEGRDERQERGSRPGRSPRPGPACRRRPSSSPTRRVPSARRPPTRTATLASASSAEQHGAGKAGTAWSLRRKLASSIGDHGPCR